MAAPILFVNDGTPYIPYNPIDSTTEQRELLEFLRQIFPVDEDREDALKMFAACLKDRGERRDERMIFLQGPPASGKSTLVELLETTFGSSCSIYLTPVSGISLAFVTDSFNLGEYLYQQRDKKISILQYDDRYQRLNTHNIKIISGTDPLLIGYRGREYYKPQTMMICHDVPEFTSMDDGLRRRIKVIPFKSKFIKRQKAEGGQGKSHMLAEITEAFGPYKEDEKIKWPEAIHYQDHEICNKLRGWAPHFAGILVWYFHQLYPEIP
jgi:phage/plasmid-associated DNA primase